VALSAFLGTSALALLSALAPGGAWAADVTCTIVATPQGPSVQQVVDVLAPGEVGCVRGTVAGNVAIRRPGVTITSEPGQRGRILGQLKVMPGGEGATIRALDLDGSPEPDKPSVGLYADDIRLVGNDITNRNTEICVIVGYGDIAPRRIRIEGNRIHHCGELPATNMDHGIYVESAVDTAIVGNEIVDNADRGVQLYPWARRTTVAGNIIDGNGVGVIFGGLNGTAASDNVVRYNVISNSRIRYDVESWYPSDTRPGTGNVVERNCISGRGINTSNGGFVARDNVFADPRYVDRARGDRRLAPGSPCADLLEAGRAGTTWSPPATEPPAGAPSQPSEPAPPVPAKPTPAKPAKPAKPSRPSKRPRRSSDGVSIGVEQTSPGTVAVHVEVVDPSLDAKPALVEVRFGDGAWRKIGRPKLRKGRAYVKRIRTPRRSRSVRVRASVLVGRAASSRTRAGRSRRGAARTRKAVARRPLTRRVFTRATRLV
jgi:parallel beta-helix repeat protein